MMTYWPVLRSGGLLLASAALAAVLGGGAGAQHGDDSRSRR